MPNASDFSGQVLLSSRQFKGQLHRIYRWYTLGFFAFCGGAGGAGTLGDAAYLDRHDVLAVHHRAVRGYRHHEPHHRRERILRGGPPGSGHL